MNQINSGRISSLEEYIMREYEYFIKLFINKNEEEEDDKE